MGREAGLSGSPRAAAVFAVNRGCADSVPVGCAGHSQHALYGLGSILLDLGLFLIGRIATRQVHLTGSIPTAVGGNLNNIGRQQSLSQQKKLSNFDKKN